MYCSGKSQLSNALSKNLGLPVIHTDDIYVPLIQKHGIDWQNSNNRKLEIFESVKDEIKEAYTTVFDTYKSVDVIVEGFALKYGFDREVIDSVLSLPSKRHEILINIAPSYDYWQYLHEQRMKETGITDCNMNYRFYSDCLSTFEPPEHYEHYTISNWKDGVLGNNDYQHEDIIRKKFDGLQLKDNGITFENKSVLDIGCAEGYIGKFCYEEGASKVVGVDNNWRFLEKAKTHRYKVFLDNLNSADLSKTGKFDITFCLSILHRVIDKEHLIQQISSVTNGKAVFELPITTKKGFLLEQYSSMPDHNKNETKIWCPTIELLEYWFSKYFKTVKYCGMSPLKYGDSSKRVVFICGN